MSSSLLAGRPFLCSLVRPYLAICCFFSSDLSGIDTGSSDLWVASDKCTKGCSSSQPAYPQASFQYSGADASLWYGDSTSLAYASGMIGKDTVTLAGLTLQDQYFVAVNRTNFTSTSASGIFGLGFPMIRYILGLYERESNN